MNRIILKFDFINNKSVKIKLILVDKRLLTKENESVIYFNSRSFKFRIYSRKTFRKGNNSFRLPDLKTYNNVNQRENIFVFSSEREMYNYLKKLNRTILECNEKFKPFMQDPYYKERNHNMIMSSEYWII